MSPCAGIQSAPTDPVPVSEAASASGWSATSFLWAGHGTMDLAGRAKRISPRTLRRFKATHLLSGARAFLSHKSARSAEAHLEIGSTAMRKATRAAGRGRSDDADSWKQKDAHRRLKEKLASGRR